MGPREFYDRFGPVEKRVVSLSAAGVILATERLDRNVLLIYPDAFSFNMTERTLPAEAEQGINVSFERPFILTHALHGTLVTLGWRYTTSAGALFAVVLESTMAGAALLLPEEVGRAPRSAVRKPVDQCRRDQRSGPGTEPETPRSHCVFPRRR